MQGRLKRWLKTHRSCWLRNISQNEMPLAVNAPISRDCTPSPPRALDTWPDRDALISTHGRRRGLNKRPLSELFCGPWRQPWHSGYMVRLQSEVLFIHNYLRWRLIWKSSAMLIFIIAGKFQIRFQFSDIWSEGHRVFVEKNLWTNQCSFKYLLILTLGALEAIFKEKFIIKLMIWLCKPKYLRSPTLCAVHTENTSDTGQLAKIIIRHWRQKKCKSSLFSNIF